MLYKYYIGVDLGKARDYTAVTVMECIKEVRRPDPADRQYVEHYEGVYHIRDLRRFPLETTYPEVIKQLKILLSKPGLPRNNALLVDKTGPGAPVVDQMRRERMQPIAIQITGGMTVTDHSDEEEGWEEYNVPKRDLVSALLFLFQANRIKVARSLELAGVLEHELLNFVPKINPLTAHDSYEAREGEHDDIVLSAALAAWYAVKNDYKQPLSKVGRADTKPKQKYHPLTWGRQDHGRRKGISTQN